eukprot:CAMPEP_0201573080 /NCGR_PEP_ID=MMETSP0190_2-20130828/16726_1 /ASSEMBLY_ACC=CAM_ASM_000263 /TAXON_ID=37353 /ORGANISM="Rosalina sp." /LENGTH=157 /DNA_ID=CAMNT_0047999613 /DNA_START=28 /DNA_END=498 /DNA_ORIENTATION=+
MKASIVSWLAMIISCHSFIVDESPNSTEMSTMENIIITTHQNITQNMIMVKISNAHLSCGGIIYDIQITDDHFYNNQYIHFTMKKQHDEYYAFYSILSHSFTAPITVKITKMYNEESISIIGDNVITSISGNKQFDFGSNFCSNSNEEAQVGDVQDY